VTGQAETAENLVRFGPDQGDAMSADRAFRIVSLVLLVALAAACGTATNPEDPGSVGDGKLGLVLETIRAEHGLPALGAVLVRDGVILESAAVGMRAAGGVAAVTLDDHWHVGSLTKAMTATLAAVLVERGTLSWSLTVGQALPELADTIRPEYVDVRLDELLRHVGGAIEDVARAPSWDTLFTATTPMLEQRRQLAEELLRFPPDAPRGTYRYSNAGYIVAGAMMEAVTGETWEETLAREVFEPLAMASSGFGAPGVAGSVTEPRGHVRAGAGWTPVEPGPYADNPRALGPAGTVHATLADYARFMAAHLAGARGEAGGLLAPATFELLHTPAAGSQYAFGWGVAERDWAGGRVLQHAGSNTMWYAVVWIAPERNLAMFSVANAAGTPGAHGTDAAIAALIARFDAVYPGGP
jgi:CubicO group peptidase (beta-lactamase class C family)